MDHGLNNTVVQVAALFAIYSAGFLAFGNKLTKRDLWSKVLIGSVVVGGIFYFI